MIAALPPKRQWYVFGLLLICHIYFLQIYPNFLSTNEKSRALLASAIVDYHAIQIDQPLQKFGDNQDKAKFNGHFYSDKAIGTSLIAIPVYFALRFLEGIWGFELPFKFTMALLRIFCVTIPALLFLRPLSRFWSSFPVDTKIIPPFIFLFLFGTFVFTYSLQFISYHLVGIFLFVSFYYLYGFKTDADASVKLLFWGGFFSGAALISEFPAVFPVAAIFFYQLYVLRKKPQIFWYMLGVLPFLVLILGYNYLIFGTPFDVTYRHMAEPAHASKHAQGLIGLGLPRIEALFGLLLGKTQGLFFFCPVLLLSLPGFYFFLKHPQWRAEATLFLAIVLSYFLVYSGMSNWNYGWAFGPRYLTPSIPFLMTACVFLFTKEKVRASLSVQLLALFLGFISVLFIIVGTITFPFPISEIKNPFFTLNVPLFFRGTFSLNLGHWLHLPSLGSAILFFTIVLLTLFAMVVPDGSLKLSRSKIYQFFCVTILAAFYMVAWYQVSRPMTAFEHLALGALHYYHGQYDHSVLEYREALNSNPSEYVRNMVYRRLLQVAVMNSKTLSEKENLALSP